MYANNKKDPSFYTHHVLEMINKNVNCTKSMITHIDYILEHKSLQESMIDSLTSIRNMCAINLMNLSRVNKI